MRCDSIEFGWAQKAAKQRRKAGAASGVAVRAPLSREATSDVMDEAFATFEDVGSEHKTPTVDRTLVATLAAQLDALDRQREHLARLLRSTEARSETSLSAAL
jgi:hypothetical protein